MTSPVECRIAWILLNLSEELSRLLNDLYEEDFVGFYEAEARHEHQPQRNHPMDASF